MRNIESLGCCFDSAMIFCPKTVEEIEMETDREKFLGPEQAVELGIVDGIIGEVSGVSKMVEETIKDFKENSAWRGAGTKT